MRVLRPLSAALFALAALSSRAPLAFAQSAPSGPLGPATLPTNAPTIAPATPSPTNTTLPANPATGPTPIASEKPTGRRLDAFSIWADQVAFYSTRFIVGAQGHVTVRLGDGTKITGNTFGMDLRLNRFLVAGDVTVTSGTNVLHGAAFAEFFDFDRAYFIPITSEPDRWTYASGDYAHPLEGREMPGDTFFLPNDQDDRPFLYAHRATIDPRQSVRFAPAEINFGLGVFVNFPAYFLSFSPNPNFAQNSLPGAFVDGPYDVAGGEHGLASAHLRYDATNKLFPAVEGHQVSANSYVVGSISPLTRPLKQYNLISFDRVSPGLQVQLNLQETAFQHSFQQPLSASGFGALQITGALPHSYLQYTQFNYYDSLLARPAPGIDGLFYYGDPTHNWVADHPTNIQLAWVGNQQYIDKHTLLGRMFQTTFRSGLTYATNSITALQTLGGFDYHQIYGKSLGVNVITQSFVLQKDRDNRAKLYFAASFDKQRQFYSVPHFTDTQTETASLTDILIPQKVTALVTYTNRNIGDFYGAQQESAYPPPSETSYVDPFTGQIIPGYASFRGFGTTRSFTQQVVFTPDTNFTLNVAMRENDDFPHPVAGLPSLIGPTYVFNNYGVTPYEADIDARFRFTQTLFIDIERSYFFGFGGFERWSPEFSVQILK